MADMSNSVAEENVNMSSEVLLNNLVKLQIDSKSITVDKGKLKWMKSFESLKKFVETSLQLKGQWTSPGGYLKLFEQTSGSAITIRYYTNTASILIQGDEGKKLENILLEKTASNQRLSEDRFAANNDESIEEDSSSDLNRSITVQITTDPDLSNSQACLGNLSNANESSILAETFTKEINFENSTAMNDNSSQRIRDEVNNVQITKTNLAHSCSCHQFATEIMNLKYKISNLQTTIFSFETILKDHDTILSLYNRSSDLNEKYLREINESKQHIINLEQKLVKLQEERDTLQLAARLIAQDKYCRNSDSNSLRWQNVSKSNTTDRDITNLVQMPNTSNIHVRNQYELLIDEGDYNGSSEPENKHESSQNHNEQNNEPQHPQEDDQRVSHMPSQAESRTQSQQSRLDNPLNESADHNPTYSGTQSTEQCVVLIGDSIIKSIIPQKLSRKKVRKFTYPGKSADEIESEIRNIDSASISASHVIIHCGTNNLPVDQSNVCLNKIEKLCSTVHDMFPNAEVGISGITIRNDIESSAKMADVNNKIKEMCTRHNYTFIDHKNINRSCLNRSNLHLNAKGAALLAVDFINFLRGGKPSATYSRNRQYENFQMERTVRQLENILRTITGERTR